MKKHIFPIIFLTILGTMACQKEEINLNDPTTSTLPDEYLIFGQVGLGWGCRVSAMYMITDGRLFADTSNTFCKVQEKYQPSGYQLSDNEYNKVKNLITQFPAELSKEGSKTFGCSGCADGGMLYIQRKEKGKEPQSWRIDETIFYQDTDVANKPFPTYLLPYGKAFGKIIPDIKYK
jgi:hypothetical protein